MTWVPGVCYFHTAWSRNACSWPLPTLLHIWVFLQWQLTEGSPWVRTDLPGSHLCTLFPERSTLKLLHSVPQTPGVPLSCW